MDQPELIIDGAIENHCKMIKQVPFLGIRVFWPKKYD
jgi:hypothetical protein